MDLKSIKSEYKRLKKKVKSSPGLFTRLASVELELGKVKSAKSRLENGIQTYPDSMIAHSLLAECFSQMGDHESSLKEWEDVISGEPFNQEARNGFIRELAFLERDDAMSDSLAELYLIDPYNIEITDRHKDALLKDIREKHPDERVWQKDWHPGDFTSIGSVARSISYERGYVPPRDNLPDGFEPNIDEDILNKILENLPEKAISTNLEDGFREALEEAPGVDDIIEELDVNDAEVKALEALLDTEEESDLDVDDFFTEKKEEIRHDEVIKSVETQIGVEYTEDTKEEVSVESAALDDSETSEDILETGDLVEETEEAQPVELDDEPEVTIVEQKVDIPKENKLKKALENCNVKFDDVIDIETLADQIFQDDFVLVEKPVIKHVEEEDAKHEISQTDLDVLTTIPKKSDDSVVDNGMEEIPPDLDQPLSQKDLDALTGSPEPAAPAEEVSAPPTDGPLSQDELNKLVAANKTKKATAEPEEKTSSGPLSQNELDAIVAANKGESSPVPQKTEELTGGSLDQSELDALVAATQKKASSTPLPPTSGTLSQEDLDSLVSDRKKNPPPAPGGSLNQSELDALVAATKQKKAAPAPEPEVKKEPSGPLSQDELNKLVAANNKSPEPSPEPPKAEEPAPGGSLSQSDLDALVAATQQKKETPSPAPEPEVEEEPSGPLSQDELNKLVAANNKSPEPTPEQPKVEEPAPGGSLSQSDLDALVAATQQKKETPSPEPAPEPEVKEEPSGPLSQDELNKLVAANNKSPELAPEPKKVEEPAPDGSLSQSDLDALVAATQKKKETPTPEPAPEPEVKEEPSGPLSQDELNKLVAANKGEAESASEKEADSIAELDDLEGPLDQNVLDNLISEHKSVPTPESESRNNIAKVAQKLRDKLNDSGVDNLDQVPLVSDEQSIEVDQATIDSVTKSKNPFEDDVTQEDLKVAIDENLQALLDPETANVGDLSNQSELDSLIQKMKTEDNQQSDDDVTDKPKVKVGTLSLEELQSHLGEGDGISFTIESRDEGDEVSVMEKVTEKAEKYSDQDEVDALLEDKDDTEDKKEGVPVSGKPALVDLPTPEVIKRTRKTPPKREDETKPTELKGPVSKTFVRLCMAQGKFKHAAEILNRLEEKTPDDPDLRKLREDISAKI